MLARVPHKKLFISKTMTLYDICIITNVGRLPDPKFVQHDHDCGDMSQNGSPVTNSGTYICVRLKFKKRRRMGYVNSPFQ